MNATAWDREHLWEYRAYPVRVIDGDTFVAMVDLGFGARYEAHLRLDGFNTPERGEPGYNEATVRLADALYGRADHNGEAGWNLRVISTQKETVVAETRSFERYVASVFVVQSDGDLIDVKDLV